MQRPSMRFVPIKTPDQQAGLVLHRTRHLFVRQQTAVINAIRAHLAEFGIVAPLGRNGVDELVSLISFARACMRSPFSSMRCAIRSASSTAGGRLASHERSV